MFTVKEVTKEEFYKAFDKRFCGYSFRKKTWPPELAVCKTEDQRCFISKAYENVPGMAPFICSELLEVLRPEDIEIVEDFEGFERNFLVGLVDPDLYDTEEEKDRVVKNFIDQIKELSK